MVDPQHLFDRYCRDGDLDKLKQLWNNNKKMKIKYYQVFRTACQNGHLNIIEWIVWLCSYNRKFVEFNEISIDWLNALVLRKHYHVVDYLIEISIKLNKPFNLKELFNYTCFYIYSTHENKMEVLNIVLKYNKNTNKTILFIDACLEYQISTMIFLQSFNPHYQYKLLINRPQIYCSPIIDSFHGASRLFNEFDDMFDICLQPTPITPDILHLLALAEEQN